MFLENGIKRFRLSKPSHVPSGRYYTWRDYFAATRSTEQLWAASKRAEINPGGLATHLAEGDYIGVIDNPKVFDATITSSGYDIVPEYMDEIIAVPSALATYKALVYAAAVETLAAQVATGNTLFWVLGNEINQANASSAWAPYAPGTQTGAPNDQSIIGTYLEADVAPMIEQVLAAEAAVGGNIKLIMGSLASAHATAAKAWATAMLDYEFVGTYAPSLAGFTMRELVNGTAAHYSIGGPLTYAQFEVAATFYHDQIGTGAIEYAFVTEEVGDNSMSTRGAGSREALLVVARTLKYIIDNGYTPTDFRANIWAVNATYGAFVIETLNILHGLLGDGHATVSTPTVTSDVATESYIFAVDTKRAMLVITSYTSATNITKIVLPNYGKITGWTGDKYTFVPNVVGGSGRTLGTYDAVIVGDNIEITLADSLVAQSALLFELPE